MKKLTIGLTALALVFSASSMAHSYGNSKDSFKIGGKIKPMCDLSIYSPDDRSLALKLYGPEAVQYQTTASIGVKCNTGQATAKVTYKSKNNGYLVNVKDANKKIAYIADLSGTSGLTDNDMQSPVTVMQVVTGPEGDSYATRSFKVKPIVNGHEYAGKYRDMIMVHVKPH